MEHQSIIHWKMKHCKMKYRKLEHWNMKHWKMEYPLTPHKKRNRVRNETCEKWNKTGGETLEYSVDPFPKSAMLENGTL